MAIAGLAYSLWMFSGYFATSKTLSNTMVGYSVFFCSFVQGIGASIMWTAQGKYMSDCVIACPDRSGLCTSTFWTIAGGSQIFSYLFNSIILGNFDPSLIFIITSLISLIAIVSFVLLPEPMKP